MTENSLVQGVMAWWTHQWSSGSWAWKAVLLALSALPVIGGANALWLIITGGYVVTWVLGSVAAVVGMRWLFGKGRTEKALAWVIGLGSLVGLRDVILSLDPRVIEIVLGGTGSAAGLIAGVWFVKWLIIGPPASVEKLTPDVLSEAATLDGVSAVMASPNGVYAGDLSNPEVSVEDVDRPNTTQSDRHECRPLRASVEDRAVVIGPPGTGKTAFLVSQILDWAEPGRSMVVLDIKPEIYGITQAALVERGYEVITYNPTAQTGHRYNPLDDVDGPEALGEMAAALIPSATAEDAVFNESARDFLDALVTHLTTVNGATSLPEIRDTISSFSGYKALMRELAQSPDGDARGIAKNLMMTAANERLLGSIFATFQSNLRFLRYPAVRDSLVRSEFSLHQLISQPSTKPVALFLQFEEQHRETTARLMAFMMGHVLRFLITHSERDAVLLLFDEIGSAPIVPGLVTKLNTIRSRKMPLWMYWQSMEQMQKYGEKANEGANTILGACDLQMVFRLNDNASADWMSQRIGVIDREVRTRSVGTGGSEGIGWTLNDSRSLVKEPIVFAHELQALRPSEVVCTYRGHTWRGIATPYFERWPQFVNQTPVALTAAPYRPVQTTGPEAAHKKLVITEPAA